jgi:hypothetical protein
MRATIIGMKVTERRLPFCGVMILLFSVVMIADAQFSQRDRGQGHETQARDYWIDPSTGLMWAAKDNGNDITWGQGDKVLQQPALSWIL